MSARFSKPPPSATRPPLLWLKPLEMLGFLVKHGNAGDAARAANSGSPWYKNWDSLFAGRSGEREPYWLRLTWLAFLAVTVALLSLSPKHPRDPHVCVKPTAMPATWFGECGRASLNMSVNRRDQ
jgi:hypothetical protein